MSDVVLLLATKGMAVMKNSKHRFSRRMSSLLYQNKRVFLPCELDAVKVADLFPIT